MKENEVIDILSPSRKSLVKLPYGALESWK
jgi:hypothetical protein